MCENHKFFRNLECEYFPCHKVTDTKEFNCLFCFCPLYSLGRECGGNFIYTERGIKDCSGCTLVHGKKGYEYVVDKLKQRKNVNEK